MHRQSAFNIVRFLRKLAAAGQAILCTIHQPNASLFENFDRLLLLQKGGETVYFGESSLPRTLSLAQFTDWLVLLYPYTQNTSCV
jgi:ABC-type multidrug transport system ATPase subunit